jgi:putative membrane protein
MPLSRRVLLNYARGLLMGGADVIPGVSGGTVALIVGIYERLIHSIRVGASALLALVRLDLDASRQRFRQVEWLLVLPLGAGVATALLVGARVIPGLLEEHGEPISALFFGLILGSVVVPLRRIARLSPARLALIAVAAVTAFVLVGLPPREISDPPLVFVFVAAAIAICAMILPGISGAFLLLVMGIYRTTLDAVTALNLAYVATFILGAVVGLGSFARVLEWLLLQRHSATMAVLTGLMIGSLRALWPWQTPDRDLLAPPDLGTFLAMTAIAALGVAVVLVVVWIGGRGEHRQLALERGAPTRD